MGLPSNPAARGALCCAGLSCVVIIGCSIAVLIINRSSQTLPTRAGITGPIQPAPPTTGGHAPWIAWRSASFMACPGGMIGNVIAGVFHVIWWAVAGDYFTKKYNAAHDVPMDNYRHAVMALCWTALSFAAIQFLFGIFGAVSMRGGDRGGDYEDRSDEKPHKHKHEHQSHAEMTDQHPPPPMANPYPAPPPPAGGYYPPPPPAGYSATQPPMAL
eukprot:XP_001698226.1 transmembrane protein of CMA family [Chlamydomonas reinhardtii]